MNKLSLVTLLITFIICNGSINLSCYNHCYKKIKRSATKAQTCIVTGTLLQLAKSNPLSVAKFIVKTITGAKTAFENCQSYIDAMNSKSNSLLEECKKKCER